MLENIQQAFQSVWNHKMRSFLTMLGIIIGIASIITIVSSIKGTSEQIKQNLIGSGTNAVVVSLYQNEYPYDSNEMGAPDGVAVITPEVRDELLKLDKVSDVSLFYQRDYNTGVFYLSTGYNGKMLGVDEHYLDLYGYQLCYGRSFVEEDFTQNRKVVLLNTQAVSTLFAGKNPVGKTVEVRGEPFTIIGVVEQGGGFKPVIENLQDYEMYADTSSGSMFITNKGWEIAYRFDQPQSVAVKATGTDDMTAAGKAVADALTSSQIKTHDGELSYQAQDLLQQAEQLQAMSTSTNRQLIWIASISLLVGGIGVMNIMLVSVAERTSEIGLKKAIGARKRRILRQLLTEAAVLTSLGGILGILAGIGLAELLGRAMQTPTAISVPAILVSVGFSMLIGIVFGLVPSVKASNLNPIDALRYE